VVVIGVIVVVPDSSTMTSPSSVQNSPMLGSQAASLSVELRDAVRVFSVVL